MKMKKYYLAFLLLLIIPSMAYASWWNPLSWNWNPFSWFGTVFNAPAVQQSPSSLEVATSSTITTTTNTSSLEVTVNNILRKEDQSSASPPSTESRSNIRYQAAPTTSIPVPAIVAPQTTLPASATMTSSTVSAPSISYVNPSVMAEGRENNLTISGSAFQVNAVVFIGGVLKLQTTAGDVSSSSILLNVPAALPAGVYGVTVTNPDGGTYTLRNALTISAPAEVSSQPTTNYATPASQTSYVPPPQQPAAPQPNQSYLNFDMNAVTVSGQDLENLQTQYAQIVADLNGGGVPEQLVQGEVSNLNQVYNAQLSAAQLTLQNAENQEKIDAAAVLVPAGLETNIEAEQTASQQCSSVALTQGASRGESSLQAWENASNCYAAAQKESSDIYTEASY